MDDDLNILYLASKSDNSVRYYELRSDDKLVHYLSMYRDNIPQMGGGWVPKRALDVMKCEVQRFFKLTKNAVIPISFIVPRKAGKDVFQKDIYPPCASPTAAQTANGWMGGNNVNPIIMSLNPADRKYEGKQTYDEITAENIELKTQIKKLEDEITALKRKNPNKHNEELFDLKLFKEDCSATKCDERSIECCTSLKRLKFALRFYSSCKHDQNAFMKFMKDIYHRVLDDYNHLITEHQNLEEITNLITTDTESGFCDILTCEFATRHHTCNRDEKEYDACITFYEATFDSLHFYFFHLYQCGLRTTKANANRSNNINNQDDYDNVYFDESFSQVIRSIKNTERNARFDRYRNNNKFSIGAQTYKKDDSTTFVDEMLSYLLRCAIKKSIVCRLVQYIEEQQYDTDCLKMDMDSQSVSAGNIELIVKDKQATKTVQEFIKATSIKSSSFNVGFIFYYWPKYKEIKQFDQNTNKYNINDHGAIEVGDLYVNQKYLTFKEEILYYKYFNITQYKLLEIKVKAYLKTEFVKGSRPKQGVIALEYELEDDKPLTFNHILALLLYTDYTDLCSDFSSTFRPLFTYEPLSSIKFRNSIYWWMSKTLREVVQLFGYKKWNEETKTYDLLGPFYSGLSYQLVFPEFELRLCSPTSTSHHIEIALRFASRDGIVVQLNNNIWRWQHDDYLSGFPCYLFSRYKEESEILFFGGHYRIKIESVRIIESKMNFESMFTALSKFNNIINGGYIKPKQISNHEKSIILNLWSYRLGDSKMTHIDQYVVKTIDSFFIQKTQIVFNLSYLCDDRCMDKALRDMIMYKISMGKDVILTEYDKINLFRETVFQAFRNIQTIIIYTTSGDGHDPCPLSFVSLLAVITKSSLKRITIKAVQCEQKSWIETIWKETRKELRGKYREKNFTILLKNATNSKGNKEDCIVIEKMMF
eukprot:310175_1